MCEKGNGCGATWSHTALQWFSVALPAQTTQTWNWRWRLTLNGKKCKGRLRLRLNRKVCEPMPSGEDAQIKLVTACNDTVHQRVQTGRRNRKCKRGCSDSNLQPSSLPFWYTQVACLLLVQLKILCNRDKRLVCRCLFVTVDGFDLLWIYQCAFSDRALVHLVHFKWCLLLRVFWIILMRRMSWQL